MEHEKLTLRLDAEIIEKAKRFAREHETSVSEMVAIFFDGLDAPPSAIRRHGPITSRLRGSLKPRQAVSEVDEGSYLRYLEEKHG